MHMTKREARQHFTQQRALLSMPQQHLMVAHMLEHFQQIPVAEVSYLMTYSSIESRNEVPVAFFEDEFHEQATRVYPLMQPGSLYLKAVAVDEHTRWRENNWGIQEPANGSEVDPQLIDFVFVPLLAFDSLGYRVGYGKGYYDRFLSLCRPNCLKVGLSWFGPVERISDTDAFDIPLNYCVTPHALYAF
jgi:5-formyltetrahydrofolate cyclo-ligase